MADAEFEDIINEVKASIQRELHGVITDFKEQMAKAAGEAVSGYISAAREPYQRRGSSGGMSDVKNYPVTESELSLKIENITQGNPAYSDSDGWDGGYINDIIESGEGYHWKKSELYRNQPWPRPFMEETGDRFVDTVIIPIVDATVSQILGG